MINIINIYIFIPVSGCVGTFVGAPVHCFARGLIVLSRWPWWSGHICVILF